MEKLAIGAGTSHSWARSFLLSSDFPHLNVSYVSRVICLFYILIFFQLEHLHTVLPYKVCSVYLNTGVRVCVRAIVRMRFYFRIQHFILLLYCCVCTRSLRPNSVKKARASPR